MYVQNNPFFLKFLENLSEGRKPLSFQENLDYRLLHDLMEERYEMLSDYLYSIVKGKVN